MSLQNRTYWTCNECQTEVWVTCYGFPNDGWKWFLRGSELNHSCEVCVERMLEEGCTLGKVDPSRINPPGGYSFPPPEPVEALEPAQTGKVPPEPSKGRGEADRGVERAPDECRTSTQVKFDLGFRFH